MIEQAPIAILPFDNLTGAEGASRQVYDIFLVEFLHLERFTVIDPGEVERVLAQERIRFTSELSREQVEKVGRELGAYMLIQGAILEYGVRQVQGFTVVDVPYISIMIKMIDAKTGSIQWASTYSRNGNDTEKVFGAGRITSLNRLTEVMAREMVNSLKKIATHRWEI
jgi:TolB-like protein